MIVKFLKNGIFETLRAPIKNPIYVFLPKADDAFLSEVVKPKPGEIIVCVSMSGGMCYLREGQVAEQVKVYEKIYARYGQEVKVIWGPNTGQYEQGTPLPLSMRLRLAQQDMPGIQNFI